MKNELHVKTVVDGLYRDPTSKALVSKDKTAYENYKQQRQQQHAYTNINNQIKDLKAEINMLKDLLIQKIGR
jgi:hypothetical protein